MKMIELQCLFSLLHLLTIQHLVTSALSMSYRIWLSKEKYKMRINFLTIFNVLHVAFDVSTKLNS